MQIPQTDKNSVEQFAKVWNYNGIHVIQTDTSLQFALDFANVVLKSFFALMQQEIAKIQQMTQAAQAGNTVVPKPQGIVVTD